MSYTSEKELIEQHGTLEDFTAATQRAVPSLISQDEADAAIDKYRAELACAKMNDEHFKVS